MWLSILSLVIGAVPAIVKEIAQAKQTLENAKTDRERIYAEERIKALEAKRDVLVAESSAPWNILVRAILTAPFAIYLWQLIVWDKIACKWFLPELQCTTDTLSPWLMSMAAMVLGFWFVTDWTRILKR